MKYVLYLKSRTGAFDATSEYENGTVTVLRGSKVSTSFAEHIRGGKTAQKYRDDREYVDINGYVIKECVFKSPSTAAQFVTGCSRNGYAVWKDKNKHTLREVLAENNQC